MTINSTPDRPFDDLSVAGLLWYINRVAFHPRGLRFAVCYSDTGEATGWCLQRDTDPPSYFDPDTETEKYQAFEATVRSIPAYRG